MSLAADEIEDILSAHAMIPSGASFHDGEMFGKWRVTAFLGKGGSGEVYRAVHTVLGTSAAIKVLVRSDRQAKERFVREAKLLSRLKSASFPQFFEYGDANGRFYLVMELLEPGGLPTGDMAIARFLRQVCDAVAELHERGVVHRDIKPGNILWRGETPVLSDLGLAKDITMSDLGSRETDITLGGVGTPGYGAPEQMERGEVTVVSDIHALGVLADRCFNGKPPRAWMRIIECATSSIPDRRYQSVDAFVDAVRRRNRARRLGMWFSLFFFAGLSVIIATILYLWFHEDGKLRQNLPQKPVVGGEMPYVPSADLFSGDKEHQILMKTDTADGAVIRLNGETVSVKKPISLEPGEYLIIGPGRLDADLSGPSNAVVRIKGCVFNNMTSVGYQKNRINYIIEDGAYLNFVNLEYDFRIRKCIKHSDGLLNGNSGDVEFNGPLTREELRKVRRDRRKREWQKELEEINAFRHDDSHTRIF